jgi:hypothetical protein
MGPEIFREMSVIVKSSGACTKEFAITNSKISIFFTTFISLSKRWRNNMREETGEA